MKGRGDGAGGGQDVAHERVRHDLRVLVEPVRPDGLVELHEPMVRALAPREDPQERGLAGAVGAHDGDVLALLDLDRRVLEEDASAVRLVDVDDSDERARHAGPTRWGSMTL